jgi:N-acyl-D-aspartate/D-glutamate deacylase
LDALTRFLHDGELRSGWASFGDFAEACDRCRPLVNVALVVGQQAARCAVVGVRPGPLDGRERAELRRLLRQALEAGALGGVGLC